MGNVQSFDDLKQLAEPLAEYLKAHYDPHCTVVVTMDGVKVVRDEVFTPFIPQSVAEWIEQDSERRAKKLRPILLTLGLVGSLGICAVFMWFRSL